MDTTLQAHPFPQRQVAYVRGEKEWTNGQMIKP